MVHPLPLLACMQIVPIWSEIVSFHAIIRIRKAREADMPRWVRQPGTG